MQDNQAVSHSKKLSELLFEKKSLNSRASANAQYAPLNK
jgi:hypothetical protein